MTRTALVALAVAACAPPVVSPRVRPAELPPAFAGGGAGPRLGAIDWRAVFADDQLEALIAAALAGNYDLQVAVQRIALARAGVLGTSGERLPQIGLAIGASARKFGRYTMEGAGNAATDITPGRRVPGLLPDLSVGFEASWEVDLWRRLARLEGAARARYLASIEGTNLVVTNLVASVATGYVDLLALDRTQEILGETVARQTQALEIMRVEKQAGRTTELAVQQFEAQLAGTRALSAATLRRTREVENELNLLAGRTPRPIARTADLLRRAVPATFAAGVPSDLLTDRADVREAEFELEAARLDVAAARSAFYPRLTISASAGYQAFSPRFLLSTPESLAYGILGRLLAPLVNRRGIEAAYHAANAVQQQAMLRYQGTVLRAFVEVATELYGLEQAAAVIAQQRSRMAAVTGTVAAADALFRAGKVTYLDILVAQQNTLDAELQLVAASREQRVALIRLYKALGGGWRGSLATVPGARE